MRDASRSQAADEPPRDNALSMLLVHLVLFSCRPRVRGRSPARLTYAIPIQLVIFRDGVVSCLRTYRPEELRADTRAAGIFKSASFAILASESRT
jgi:hypothetical protein